MTKDELKLRQLTNQYLIEPAEKLRVVQDLCGAQAQFMGNALHSLKIRCNDFDEATAADGLVKNWTVRGTVHVFAEADLPLFMHCNNGADYRKNEWNGYSFWNQRDVWALTPERQSFLSQVILDALARQPYTREELKEICRANGMTEDEESSMFDQWGGGIRELCERGFMNYVVQEKKAFCLSPDFTPMPEEKANLELARRYFTNFGPATIHDAMYYFHASAAQVKQWMAKLPLAETEWEGRTYYYIENGKSYHHDMPKCLFLAGFDQLMLGYEKKESLYLPQEHLRSIFNLAGIVMPALLLDGRVVGKWKLKNRKLSIELFTKLGAGDKKAVKEKAEELWSDLKTVEFAE